MSNYKKELHDSELKQVVGGVTVTFEGQSYECDNPYTLDKCCPNQSCRKSGNIFYSSASISGGKRVCYCGDCGYVWSAVL